MIYKTTRQILGVSIAFTGVLVIFASLDVPIFSDLFYISFPRWIAFLIGLFMVGVGYYVFGVNAEKEETKNDRPC